MRKILAFFGLVLATSIGFAQQRDPRAQRTLPNGVRRSPQANGAPTDASPQGAAQPAPAAAALRGRLPVDPLSLPPRRTDAPPLDLAGDWTGVLVWNDTVLEADLRLNSSDQAKRRLGGELHFKSLASAAPRPMPQQPVEGSWKVEGMEDPGSGVVLLEGRGWISQPARGIRPMNLGLVYAGGKKELAGQVEEAGANPPDQPYCLFVRADEGEAFKTLAEHAAAATSMPKMGDGTPPSDDAIAKWSQRYLTEYPNSAMNDPLNKTAILSLPLLRDEAFKPVFGESYDRIDYGQLAQSMRRVGAPVEMDAGQRNPLRGAERPPQLPPSVPLAERQAARQKYMQELQDQMKKQQAQRPDMEFIRTHPYIGTWLRPSSDRIIAAAAIRTIDAWEEEQVAHFRNDAPAGSAFDDMAATEQAIKTRMIYAWPSEKAGWGTSFDQIRTSTAEATLAANLRQTMQATPDVAGAKILAAWARDNAQLLKFAPPDKRDAAERQVSQKLDDTLTPLMAQAHGELVGLGSGQAAIRAQVLWYDKFIGQFGFAVERGPVKNLLAELMHRRDNDLAAAKDDFLKEIDRSTTQGQLDALLRLNLSIPGDTRMPSYPAIAEAVARRRMAIDQAKMLSMYSERERAMMDKPGHIDLKKWDGKGPNEDEVRLAVLRGYAAGGGRMVDDHTARCVSRIPQLLMMPFTIHLTISELKVSAIKRLPDSNDFECHFQMKMATSIPADNEFSIDPNLREGAEMAAQTANMELEGRTTEDHQETFRLCEDGWQAVDLRDGMRALQSISNMFQVR